MSGVVFIITIPTEEHEKILIEKAKRKVIINELDPAGVNKNATVSSKCSVSETQSVSSQVPLVSVCTTSKDGARIKPSNSSSSLPASKEVMSDENNETGIGRSMCKVSCIMGL